MPELNPNNVLLIGDDDVAANALGAAGIEHTSITTLEEFKRRAHNALMIVFDLNGSYADRALLQAHAGSPPAPILTDESVGEIDKQIRSDAKNAFGKGIALPESLIDRLMIDDIRSWVRTTIRYETARSQLPPLPVNPIEALEWYREQQYRYYRILCEYPDLHPALHTGTAQEPASILHVSDVNSRGQKMAKAAIWKTVSQIMHTDDVPDYVPRRLEEKAQQAKVLANGFDMSLFAHGEPYLHRIRALGRKERSAEVPMETLLAQVMAEPQVDTAAISVHREQLLLTQNQAVVPARKNQIRERIRAILRQPTVLEKLIRRFINRLGEAFKKQLEKIDRNQQGWEGRMEQLLIKNMA